MNNNESAILTALDPYSNKIKNCISEAVKHYQLKLSDESKDLSQTTKSSYIRDFIIKNIHDVFSTDFKVKIQEKRRMVILQILSDPVICLKFKKFDSRNRISCARTLQAANFSAQGELFPNYGNSINLHAGYKWRDESYTEIDCLIGLPNSLRGHEWVALIPDSGIVQNILETTKEEIIKPQPKIKLKENISNEKVG